MLLMGRTPCLKGDVCEMKFTPRIVEYLLRVMKKKKINAADLMINLNFCKNTMRRYSLGQASPSVERFVTMLDALDLELVIRPKASESLGATQGGQVLKFFNLSGPSKDVKAGTPKAGTSEAGTVEILGL